ncbi:two component transcriptional regulator, winged helix family [Desulfacinum hydrothermale DSM 13146]|uniref:Two component transcriptional regulator, winged helix family n=1 Tax=Desulfacinum hydrothermale DSM 13146 TaxID=1121390 RepID=A0A1W1XE26_9BACT|nr:response regulator transcription factor [Desulfacinum hydrothermale]SMC21898.1 two component transcriptional regulator, winged helix family [Desulfacinum hydrothermale DSM 13146]
MREGLRLLVVDDDVELCELLTEYLEPHGFQVTSVHDGEAGLQAVGHKHFDLVVLDVMLPGLDGLEVLRRLRALSPIPVVMLTARGDDVDRIVGLELGADDYLPKPFNPRELLARLRAVLRRARQPESKAQEQDAASARPEVLRVGDVELHPGTRTVSCGGRPVRLTTVEFNLLEVLLRGAGRVLSREELSLQVLGRKLQPFDRSLDVHVSNLRKKLGEGPRGVERIKTVRGVGYLYGLPEGDGPNDLPDRGGKDAP